MLKQIMRSLRSNRLLTSVLTVLLTACTAPASSLPGPSASTPSMTTVTPTLSELFQQDSFRFHTSEWFAQGDPLNATVTVKRIAPQVVSAHFKFAAPLDPTKWANPSMFSYFMFCFAEAHSRALGYTQWALGGNPDQIFDVYTSTEVTIDFAALHGPSELAQLKNLKDGDANIQWNRDLVSKNDSSSSFCKKLFKPEFVM